VEVLELVLHEHLDGALDDDLLVDRLEEIAQPLALLLRVRVELDLAGLNQGDHDVPRHLRHARSGHVSSFRPAGRLSVAHGLRAYQGPGTPANGRAAPERSERAQARIE